MGLAGNAWADHGNNDHGAAYVHNLLDGGTYDSVVTPTAGVTDQGPTQPLDSDVLAPGEAGYTPRWELEDGTIFVCPVLGVPNDEV